MYYYYYEVVLKQVDPVAIRKIEQKWDKLYYLDLCINCEEMGHFRLKRY